ncbi:MAG: hypothetical protein C4541_00190 [Candidatus Auribacter fodinae]|jgi:hypothetical protein|uniref:pEK499-p136 HEPN domain-containing protein n=1 Tax=Candidatus Auribacter fodinae TaxID=2093366 RepID=A0A3A4RAX3_9BACT|nr:MAG: hypothetical protein C4541_00190 [Candidatus Auribacter fodinae]
MTAHKSLADFVERTRENLAIICNRQNNPGDGKYEVTQLMNSLLGLFMFPQQYYSNKDIPSFAPPERSCLPEIKQTVEKGVTLKPARDMNSIGFHDLTKHLRNAIAHYKVRFIDDKEMIKGVEFSDDNKFKKGDKFDQWVMTFDSIDKLKKFVDHFSSQIGKFAEKG